MNTMSRSYLLSLWVLYGYIIFDGFCEYIFVQDVIII